MKIGLVACAAKKLDRPTLARDLYISPLFRKASAYCEREYDCWYVLSAKHHLAMPDQVLQPYDETLNTQTHLQRKMWGSRVRAQLCGAVDDIGGFTAATFYLHAGRRYTEYLAPWLLEMGADVTFPLSGLGIGQQLRWYIERGIR